MIPRNVLSMALAPAALAGLLALSTVSNTRAEEKTPVPDSVLAFQVKDLPETIDEALGGPRRTQGDQPPSLSRPSPLRPGPERTH